MKKIIKKFNIEMKKEFIFVFFSIKKNLLSSAELRTSFLINIFGMMLNNTAFVILWMAFGKIAGNMGGWQAVDVLGQIGLGSIGFGLCFTFFGGIRDLPEIVASGNFDKYMLSPKNILLRLSTSATTISAIGDLLVGIVMLIMWFIIIKADFVQIIFSAILGICSGVLFYFFSVAVNCVSFYFTESRSIVQGLFEFLITPSLFYGGAFQGILRFVFIFIVPALLVGGFPVEIIKDESLIRLFFTIFITIIWGLLSIWIFNRSVREYESANFINFN